MKFSRLVKTTAAMLSLAVALGCTACAPDKQTPTPEPKVNYADVFVFMGQSNMAGRGEAADAIDCEWGHGYEYRAVSGSDEDGWLYPVEEPFGAEENNAALSDGENGDGKNPAEWFRLSAKFTIKRRVFPRLLFRRASGELP